MLLLAPLFLAVFALFVYGVMLLWNWLMPAIFGLPVLSYWQALGVLVLSKILFGSLHGGRGGMHARWKRRMRERWEKMTPEERERFMRGACGPFGAEEAVSR